MRMFCALLVGLGLGFLLGYGRKCLDEKAASAEHISDRIEDRLGKLEQAV